MTYAPHAVYYELAHIESVSGRPSSDLFVGRWLTSPPEYSIRGPISAEAGGSELLSSSLGRGLLVEQPSLCGYR